MNAPALVTALARRGASLRATPAPALNAMVDWPTVVDLAVRHRVAPLVWQALTGAPAGAVPEPIRARLEEQMWHSRAGQLLCEHALQALLETLAAAGIDALVLKGAALAHSLYPCPELRPYHDLDIVCRPADYARLYRALRAQGYTDGEMGNEPQEALTRKPSALESHRVRELYSPAGGVKIEVHFDILQFGLRERHHDDFWREARVMQAGALQMRVLAPTHQLLHLAAHAHRHGYSRLIWLIDLDLLLRRQGHLIDWERAMRLARDEGVSPVVWHALATAHALLATPWPRLPRPTTEERLLGGVYRALWPRDRVARLERQEHRRLLRFQPGTNDPRDVAYGFALLGRRREKWHILRRYASQLIKQTPRRRHEVHVEHVNRRGGGH